MKSRIHYGEFNLYYWLKLILSKDIILPPYQRSFVWTEKQVLDLLKSISKGDFIPPVTIGKLKNQNIIIDGQQRLTSILLGALQLFPSKVLYHEEEVAPEVEGDDIDKIEYYNWTFDNIISKDSNLNLAQLRERYQQHENFKLINTNYVNDEFLKSHRLGFSYVVPNAKSKENEQNEYFSTVFRNVNYCGKPLLKTESRKSLYYLNDSYLTLFEPNFINELKVKQFNVTLDLDFVRVLALTAEYALGIDLSNIARGFKTDMEAYYHNFIYSIIKNKSIGNFIDLNKLLSKKKIEGRISQLSDSIKALNSKPEFNGIIESDLHMFGLTYWIVWKDYTLKTDKIPLLLEEISKKVAEFKSDEKHSRSPSAMGFLRNRLKTSIELFKSYVTQIPVEK